MILIERPGRSPLEIEFLLLNFEGTLANDRRVHPKAKDKLHLLSKRTKIYIFSKTAEAVVSQALRKVPAEVIYLKEGEATLKKLHLIEQLGENRVAAFGNGADDVPMIEKAALGIAVLSQEGTVAEVMSRADLVVMNILDGLDFLLKPLRQKTTLGT